MNEKIKKHYAELLSQHGDSAESAQYSSRESQENRFEVLTAIAPLNDLKILDFGCGTGHLATFLEKKNIQVDYTGVDVVEEFFTYGREKHPDQRFGRLSDFADESFDYAFVSGVFNNKIEDNQSFYEATLIDLFARVKYGVAFNMMSKYVDYEDQDLFYVFPEEIFEFAKRMLTPYVCLRNDYLVKQNSVPFEFAVYAYKK